MTIIERARIRAAVVLSVTALLVVTSLAAQAPQTPGGTPALPLPSEAASGLTTADVEAAATAMEADPNIPETVKAMLRPKFKEALATLKAAAEFAARADEYRKLRETAPKQAAQCRAQLKQLVTRSMVPFGSPQDSEKAQADVTRLPPVGKGGEQSAGRSVEDLQKKVTLQRATVNELTDELSKSAAELARVKGRPIEVTNRLPVAQRELAEIDSQLAALGKVANDASNGKLAERFVLQAQQTRTRAELEMLKQEQLSQTAREDLLQAQRNLLARQLQDAAVRLSSLETQLQQRLTHEAKQVKSLAETLPQDVPRGDKAAQELADEVQGLAKEFEAIVENLKKVQAAKTSVASGLKDLNSEYDNIRQALELGSGGRTMAQALFELQSRAFAATAEVHALQVPTLEQTRLASFQVGTKLRQQPAKEKQFSQQDSKTVATLLAARYELLDKLRTQYDALGTALVELEGEKHQYLDKAEEIRTYVAKQLFGFGMRSCPPISIKTLTQLPASARWMFSSEHWQELGAALRGMVVQLPLGNFGVALVVAVLVLTRRRIGAALAHTGDKIRRISTDRYRYTAEALAWTLLLAIPAALAIGFVGWALELTDDTSDWIRGISYGLKIIAEIIFIAGFLAAVCRQSGIGVAHFRWKPELLKQCRRALQSFCIVYLPMLLVTISCVFGEASLYVDSIGTISFILAHAWAIIVLWRLFFARKGVLAILASDDPRHVLIRWRYLWAAVLFAAPLALIVLVGLGFVITTIWLSVGLLLTFAMMSTGSILYGLALRWFTMKQRKLALAEALERRRVRQQAVTSPEPQEQQGEILPIDAEEERQLDLNVISEQTRALLRLAFLLGVSIAIIVFWSETFPLIAVFDTIRIPLTGGLSLYGLMQAALALAVTYFAVQNLPGLLELAVLRATTIQSGTRNAITTLCQYGVTLIGLAIFFNILNVDWAKFGWIAAALSVGLGFGLQEVVANFVCGVILLFERPIRVGDIVTLDNMTGTVTRIRMRATTITNWDRQEIVVPNKTLITNNILNWTLTSALNRFVISVGVAYGSDTVRARQILLDVAASDPRVLDDPAPMATFEQFADSSLSLVLRAYLPDLENRLATITDLHTEIAKRFAEAGIEIPFPQRDLHLHGGGFAPSK